MGPFLFLFSHSPPPPHTLPTHNFACTPAISPRQPKCIAGKTFSGSGNAPCSAVTVKNCPQGYGFTAATSTADGKCTQCVYGSTFNAGTNTGTCAPVKIKECATGLGLSKAITEIRDGVCTSCVPTKTWKAGTNANECGTCRSCPTGIKTACTKMSNNVCQPKCIAGKTFSKSGYGPCETCWTGSCGLGQGKGRGVEAVRCVTPSY